MNKKRQGIRRALILISFLLFPVTLYYFSPVIIIMGVAEGVIAGCFIVFLLQFVTAFFLGRSFCGWLCAAAGLQEACFAANDKKVSNRYNWVKYVIWIPWITAIVVTCLSSGGLVKVDFFYRTRMGISVSAPKVYPIYLTVTGVIMILAFAIGRRAFCHYGCWMAPFMIIGTKLGSALRVPALHLKARKEKCNECKRCTRNCPMSLDVDKMVLEGSMKHAECILCANCIDNCPTGAIEYRFGARPQ